MIFLSAPSLVRAALLVGTLAVTASSVHAATVLIDFGNPNTTGNWNSMTDPVAGAIANALDSTGSATGMTVTVTSRFNATNGNGTTDPTAPYPAFVTNDLFYGNALAGFNGQPAIANSTVTFSGLTVGQSYSFTFFASRTGVADNRETRYTLTGAGSPALAELNAANNVTGTATVSNVLPNASGVITLNVGMGNDNNNPTGFYYLGSAEISFVPEPGSAVLLLGGLALAGSRRRC